MPEVRTPAAEDLTKLLKDAVYVTIGLGVIAVQKAQVRRQELSQQVSCQVGDAKSQFQSLTKVFDALLDQLEEHLPEQARELAQQARTAAKEARSQVRGLTRRPNGASAA
jgi:ATP-dependent protease HslVU (ClpYQ) peptidase subunit